jgi:hypothetical protein
VEEMKKRIAWLVVAAAALAFGLSGCASILDALSLNYGKLSTDGSLESTGFAIGGFPSGTINPGTNYQVDSGTYEIYYICKYWDGSYYKYYPGLANGSGVPAITSSANYYYHYTYTIHNSTGTAKYFTLYLDHDGLYYTSNISASGSTAYASRAVGVKAGAQTCDLGGGASMTVTSEIVQLSPEAAAALGHQVLVKQ